MGVLLLLFIFIFFASINSTFATTYTCNSSISCGCSTASTVVTSRIIGGEAATDHAWAWMVSFQRSDKHICGATLLTSEYAVTGAHCIEDGYNITILSILAGTNYMTDVSSTTSQRRSILKIIIHPSYDSYSDLYTNDIAILQFSPLTVSSNSNIAFICLPEEDQDPFQINTNLVALGWGVTVLGGVESDYLQQVTLQVISSTSIDCIQSEIHNASVQFCAGTSTGGKDTCQGDSGGPIMAFNNNVWVLAGITSTGYYCAFQGYPGVYTRVSSFVSFINSNIGGPVKPVAIAATAIMTPTSRTNYIASTTMKNTGNIIDKSLPIIFFLISFCY